MVIDITLDELEKGMKQILLYKKEFVEKANFFLQYLCKTGVDIARVKVMKYKAVDTLQLATGLDFRVLVSGKEAIIVTNCGYAAYVEFGTGIMGEISSHPIPGVWRYDIKHHGDNGWVYYDERKKTFKWTQGMMAKPFFYETANVLGQRTRQLAREVFRT